MSCGVGPSSHFITSLAHSARLSPRARGRIRGPQLLPSPTTSTSTSTTTIDPPTRHCARRFHAAPHLAAIGRPPKTSLPPKDLDSEFGITELKLNRLWATVSGVDPDRSLADRDTWDCFRRHARRVHGSLGFELRLPYTAHAPAKRAAARAELLRRVEAAPELAARRGLRRDDVLDYKLAVTHHNMRNYWRRQAGLTSAEWMGFDRIGHRKAGRAEGDERNTGRKPSKLLQEVRESEALAQKGRIWRKRAHAGAHFLDARVAGEEAGGGGAAGHASSSGEQLRP